MNYKNIWYFPTLGFRKNIALVRFKNLIIFFYTKLYNCETERKNMSFSFPLILFNAHFIICTFIILTSRNQYKTPSLFRKWLLHMYKLNYFPILVVRKVRKTFLLFQQSIPYRMCHLCLQKEPPRDWSLYYKYYHVLLGLLWI